MAAQMPQGPLDRAGCSTLLAWALEHWAAPAWQVRVLGPLPSPLPPLHVPGMALEQLPQLLALSLVAPLKASVSQVSQKATPAPFASRTFWRAAFVEVEAQIVACVSKAVPAAAAKQLLRAV